MSNSASGSERLTPPNAGRYSASPVPSGIWSGTLKQDILQAGGTWPPAGTRTIADHSALGATSSTKANSGSLGATLSESELERLMKFGPGEKSGSDGSERNSSSSMESSRLTWMTSRGAKVLYGKGRKRNKQEMRKEVELMQLHRVDYWQRKRREALEWFIEIERLDLSGSRRDKLMGNATRRYEQAKVQLYKLTRDERYKPAGYANDPA